MPFPPAPYRGIGQGSRRQEGSVTAETAMVLPALVVVLAALLWFAAGAVAQLRCVDAARAGARALARGEAVGAARAAALGAGPPGALVRLEASGDLVSVDVSASVRPFPAIFSALPGVPVHSRAVAAAEGKPS